MVDLACFSSVALFSPGNGVCEACPHAAACCSGALDRLDLLPDLPETAVARQRLTVLGQALGLPGRAVMPVTVSRRGVARRALTEGEQQSLLGLPARARNLARSLMARGWFEDARKQLQRGTNPGRPGTSMAVVCALMLAGGSSRADAVQALCGDLGIKPASANVELSTVLAVLRKTHIADVNNGWISLTPTLAGQHSNNDQGTR